jgi:DNA-binding Xre family transcriptional regulator
VLRALMERRGLSENQLADRVGISQQTLNRFMRGGGTRIEFLAKLCESLNMTPGELFSDVFVAGLLSQTGGGTALERAKTLLDSKDFERIVFNVERTSRAGALETFVSMLDAVAMAAISVSKKTPKK